MKKVFLAILAIITLLIFSYVSAHVYTKWPDLLTLSTDNYVWGDNLNIFFNTYFSWKRSITIDYIANFITKILLKPYESYLFSCTLIFTLGLFVYFTKFVEGVSLALKLILTLTIGLSCKHLFSVDSTALQSICFLPWLAFSMRGLICDKKNEKFFLPGFFLSLYLFLTSANQLAIPLVLGLAIYFYLTINELKTDGRLGTIVIGLTLLSAFLVCLTAPYPVFPAYPHLGRVVSDDNLPGLIMPLIGPFPVIPVINRELIKLYYYIPSLVAFILSLLVLFTFKNGPQSKRNASILVFILATSCLLETFSNEAISLISPIYTTNRLIPGLFYFNILPVVLGLTFVLIGIICAEKKRTTLLAILIIALSTQVIDNSVSIRAPLESRINTMRTLQNMLQNKELNEEDYNTKLKVLASPSFNVVNQMGLHTGKATSSFALKTEQVSHNEVEFIEGSANSHRKQLMKIFDSNPATRWSPQIGKQVGDEWLAIMFKQPHQLNGILMDSGQFLADFPRGIIVMTAANCSENQGHIEGDFATIFSTSQWQGSLEYTPDGYPYFGSQSKVSILFPENKEVKCLLVKQVGKEDSFDWSIAELLFLKK